MKQDRRWINQYVPLSQTVPDQLLSFDGQRPSPDEIALVQSRFKNSSKVIVEIGSGSGQHLIGLSRKQNNATIIGIELRYKRAYRTAQKAQKASLPNCFVIRGDANYIAELFPASSVDEIFINFPDPWDRKKWLKHRMISEKKLPLYHSILKDGGVIRYKTDHQPSFKDALCIIQESELFYVETHTFDLYRSDSIVENIPTEFEQLFLSQNLPIGFAVFKKNLCKTVSNTSN